MFRSSPHLSDAVNRRIVQSEVEGGVHLGDVAPGTVLEVELKIARTPSNTEASGGPSSPDTRLLPRTDPRHDQRLHLGRLHDQERIYRARHAA